MGVIYYVACEACHEYADLDKFYACCSADHGQSADDHVAYVAGRIRDGHLIRSAVLVAFIGSHMGHQVKVYTEHDALHDRILDENEAADIATTKRPWLMTMDFGTDSLRDAVAKELGKSGGA